jgi:4-hydroxybenzoate polyprenyltransferase
MATALARSSHPGPSAVITATSIALGIGIGLDWARVVILGLAMLFGQLSVGLSNDWLDAARDRASERPDKATVTGSISVSAVRNAAWVCVVLMFALEIPLGLRAAIALTICIAAAWAYNLGLKASVIATALYIIGFGTIPLAVTLSLSTPRWAAWWALGVAALFGIAGHFANALPDLEADRSNGVLSLPQRIGPTGSRVTTYLALVAAGTLEYFGAGGVAFAPGIVSTLVSCFAGVAGMFLAARPTRWHFRIILAAALVDVVVLAIAGSRVLG